jgi:aminomuconate-semialdehyde/2-hydroxymuconate-6-semialdehyde dehydrogenase
MEDSSHKLTNYIDGRRSAPDSGRYLEVFEPAAGTVFAHCPDSGRAEMDAAVAAAQRAFPAWSATSAPERARMLERIADLLEVRLEEFARAESRDNGKPLALARSLDIPRAVANLRFFAAAATQFASEAHATGTDAINYTLRQPLGVVGCISPWNLPLYLFTWKIAPALAAGNCVVAKPSEVTPYTAAMFARSASRRAARRRVEHRARQRTRRRRALVEHAGIAISFTGSTRTGAAIAAITAPKFRKLSLEMGGKNPTVIFADWEPNETNWATVVRSAFSNQGQICLCGSRLLIERTIYGKFKNAFLDKVRHGASATRMTRAAIAVPSSRARISTRSWVTSRWRAKKAARSFAAATR